jgi:glutamine synthetase type III
MSRVINTDSTGKQRNQLMRTAAEMLRRLSQKQTLDDEAKDMVATLVFCLREIEEGIDSSAAAWEKRDYWMKADELRTRWSWVSTQADALAALVFDERWNDLPTIMVKLLPYFNDINITKYTRKEDTWMGSHARLLRERAPREG